MVQPRPAKAVEAQVLAVSLRKETRIVWLLLGGLNKVFIYIGTCNCKYLELATGTAVSCVRVWNLASGFQGAHKKWRLALPHASNMTLSFRSETFSSGSRHTRF